MQSQFEWNEDLGFEFPPSKQGLPALPEQQAVQVLAAPSAMWSHPCRPLPEECSVQTVKVGLSGPFISSIFYPDRSELYFLLVEVSDNPMLDS